MPDVFTARASMCCPFNVPTQILEIKTEAPELIGSLQTLSTFYTDNTAASRRALRSTVEKRSLLICDKFITAAEDVIRVGALGDAQIENQRCAGLQPRGASMQLLDRVPEAQILSRDPFTIGYRT